MGWDLIINTLFLISMEGSWRSFGTVGCSEPTSMKSVPPVAREANFHMFCSSSQLLSCILALQGQAVFLTFN